MKNVIDFGKAYLKDNKNYEANAQIMLSATFALNGISSLGTSGGDWNTHGLEHQLSAYTDFTHGTGLGLIQPYVLITYLNKDIKENLPLTKFINLGRNVFGLDIKDDTELAKEVAVQVMKLFFGWLGKTKLSEYDVTFAYDKAVAKLLKPHMLNDAYHTLDKEELEKIYQSIQ
jgi:alcohol dehydrogenase YqhD (iron-dependent ADH family)